MVFIYSSFPFVCLLRSMADRKWIVMCRLVNGLMIGLVQWHLPNVNSVADSSSRFAAPWLLKAPQVDITLSSKFTKNDPPSQILATT